jgi:hypothetical protein
MFSEFDASSLNNPLTNARAPETSPKPVNCTRIVLLVMDEFGFLFGLKRPEGEADSSAPSSKETQNIWSLLSMLSMSLRNVMHIHRDTFL